MAAPGRSQRKGTRIATLLALAAVLATANATVTSHEDQGRAALKALQHRAVLEQDNGEASEASLFQRFLRWKEPQGCWTAALENAQFEHSCDKIDSEQTRRFGQFLCPFTLSLIADSLSSPPLREGLRFHSLFATSRRPASRRRLAVSNSK